MVVTLLASTADLDTPLLNHVLFRHRFQPGDENEFVRHTVQAPPGEFHMFELFMYVEANDQIRELNIGRTVVAATSWDPRPCR